MRGYAALAALSVYAGSRASVQLAHGVAADSGSPLIDTATQGGIVAVCIGLVYFFLQRGDRLAKTQKDTRVAELEAHVAELRGREAGYEERLRVLDIEMRALRLDWINDRDKLLAVQAEQITLMKENQEFKLRESQLIALAAQTKKRPHVQGDPTQ